MSPTTAFLAILVISALNAGVVFVVSLFGVYGDGSAGVMPIVLVVGLAWVGGFLLMGLYLVSRGRIEAGVQLCGKALPYAFLVLMVVSTLWLLWIAATGRM